MKMKNALMIATAGLALAVAGNANAAITIYSSTGAFDAATTAKGVDTFENLSITSSTSSPMTRSAGAYSYVASASTTTFFGAGSAADHWLSTNTATDTITFSGFTGGVSAIGGLFFASDITGLFGAGGVTLTATDSFGATSTQLLSNATTSTFLGFVSTGTITSLTLTAVQPVGSFLWPTANNLTLAKTVAAPAVPEPTTWAMMIGGLGLVGAMLRRRAKVTAVTFA